MRMADTISRSETMTGEQIKISVNSVFISRQETSWPDTRCWEKAYKEGKARSLGISNFQGEKLERLLSESEIKPHVIQMEVHPYFTQKEIRERLSEFGTKTMGWYPLGHGDRSLIDEEIFKNHGVTQKEMAAIITHVAFYCGWPKAWAVFRLAKEVYEEA